MHTDGRILDVNEAAFDDEIVAWNFQIELALHQLRIRHLDFGAPLGKIDDSTGKALAALERDRDRLKVRPRAEYSLVVVVVLSARHSRCWSSLEFGRATFASGSKQTANGRCRRKAVGYFVSRISPRTALFQ